MNEKPPRESVKWVVMATGIVLPLAILVWLNQDAVWAFIGFICDRDAVVGYLETLGAIGPLVLTGLIGLQVLIPSLPAEPPMVASAYAYGFTAGFLMNWLVSVAVSQVVFHLARHAGRPVVERLVPAKHLGKWTRTASERGTMFFLLAFVIPPVPSDILIYVAGLSTIEAWRFFVANLLGRMPMILLLTLVGACGLSITPAMIGGLTAIGVLTLVAWLWYVRPSPVAGVSSVLSETGRARRPGSPAPMGRRRLQQSMLTLARKRGSQIRPDGRDVSSRQQHLAVWPARLVDGAHRKRGASDARMGLSATEYPSALSNPSPKDCGLDNWRLASKGAPHTSAAGRPSMSRDHRRFHAPENGRACFRPVPGSPGAGAAQTQGVILSTQ